MKKEFRRKRIKLESHPVTIQWVATLECGHKESGTMTAKKWGEGKRPSETLTCWQCEQNATPKLNIKKCQDCHNGREWFPGKGWVQCQTCGGAGTLPAN